MTNEEFISLVKAPDSVKAEHTSDLKEMVDLYPGFVQARILYVKALQKSHNLNFAPNLKLATLYCANRRWLYYYIYPEKKVVVEPFKRESKGKSSGDYFDMINTVVRKGGDTKKTLKNLAERLKSARAMVTGEVEKTPKTITVIPKIEEKTQTPLFETIRPEPIAPFVQPKPQINVTLADTNATLQESKAKKLIRERKYEEAIEILEKLNLNNPKKSVYFADQIRFLEKIIANSNK